MGCGNPSPGDRRVWPGGQGCGSAVPESTRPRAQRKAGSGPFLGGCLWDLGRCPDVSCLLSPFPTRSPAPGRHGRRLGTRAVTSLICKDSSRLLPASRSWLEKDPQRLLDPLAKRRHHRRSVPWLPPKSGRRHIILYNLSSHVPALASYTCWMGSAPPEGLWGVG